MNTKPKTKGEWDKACVERLRMVDKLTGKVGVLNFHSRHSASLFVGYRYLGMLKSPIWLACRKEDLILESDMAELTNEPA